MSKIEFLRFVKNSIQTVELIGKNGIVYWLKDQVIQWVDTSGVVRTIPEGLISDGYSVPKFLWGLVRGLKSRLPAYLHDYLYLTHSVTKYEADCIIRDAIIATEGGRYTAWKVFLGLFFGGWYCWWKAGRAIKTKGLDAVTADVFAQTFEEAEDKARRGVGS